MGVFPEFAALGFVDASCCRRPRRAVLSPVNLIPRSLVAPACLLLVADGASRVPVPPVVLWVGAAASLTGRDRVVRDPV